MIAAGWFLLGVFVGIVFLAICMVWDRQAASVPVSRPSSSNRKAGRTRVQP